RARLRHPCRARPRHPCPALRRRPCHRRRSSSSSSPRSPSPRSWWATSLPSIPRIPRWSPRCATRSGSGRGRARRQAWRGAGRSAWARMLLDSSRRCKRPRDERPDARYNAASSLKHEDRSSPMSDSPAYVPPKVWTWKKENGGQFSTLNRPTAGATHDKVLPVGRPPLQLYSLATPNGVKVTVMLEELLALGHRGAEYDAWLIRIDGNQFGSGFVAVNPNSKIPALLDRSGPKPIRLFE